MYVVTALIASVIQYLMTGKGPEDSKDLMFPRTGRKHQDGSEERLSLPSYVKDIYEYLHHPGTTIIHKANPIWGMIYEHATGEDYFGNRFVNPDAPPGERMKEHLEQAGRDMLPFAMQGHRQFQNSEQPGTAGAVQRAMPYAGFQPAPGAVTSPEEMERREHIDAEKSFQKGLIQKLRQAQAAHDKDRVRDLEQQIQESRRHLVETDRDYRQQQRRGHPTSQLMDKVGPLIDGASSHAEMASRIQSAGFPALATLFRSLPDTLRPSMQAQLQRYA
jgi:hypothetical protein